MEILELTNTVTEIKKLREWARQPNQGDQEENHWTGGKEDRNDPI